MEKDNLVTIHRPLRYFYYGSLAVIFLSLMIGAYFFSYSFLENEKKRAEISTLQLKESLNSEYRYIVEEFFTSSYDSISIRISNALEKFGRPDFDLYLFNNAGECVHAVNHQGLKINCDEIKKDQDNELSYITDLKLATNTIGSLRVNVEDRFQFAKGSLSVFALKFFSPVFLIVAILWIGWVLYSRKKILLPYYNKMLKLEKEKASFDTVRQIIHDTKGEIASLDLLSYEIDDKPKADEMRATLDKIRTSFENLHQTKGTIVSVKNEALHKADQLLASLEAHHKIKYKGLNDLKMNFYMNGLEEVRLKLDSSLFERVVSNIVENSVTAPCRKSIREIDISARIEKEKIVIEIKDNGEGILEVDTGRIFEKGFTTKSTGTGQGLPFVKTQIEEWKGEISFRSDRGIGTIFTIKIPMFKKPKVIVLDDDLSLLSRYKKMLERFGNEAEIYSSGKSLIENAKYINTESIFLLDYDLGANEVGTDVAIKLNKMGMTNIYLHTGNPMTEEIDFPFLKGILSKGNFTETMKTLSLS